MSRHKKTYVGKIGFCDNSVLGLTGADGKTIKGGHYVYIREVNGSKCNVNIITSLEGYVFDDKGNRVKDKYGVPIKHYDFDKLDKAKHGYLYPLPKSDVSFRHWSAVNLDDNIKGVKIADIQNIGKTRIKSRHKFFVGKYSGKYTKK